MLSFFYCNRTLTILWASDCRKFMAVYTFALPMKAVTYIVCLFTMLLNVAAPAATSSWGIGEFPDSSDLHFEKERHHRSEHITPFQFLVTDETNDNADSENEDSDSFFHERAITAAAWQSFLHGCEYSLKSKERSFFAKANTPFVFTGIPVYIQQRVLRI